MLMKSNQYLLYQWQHDYKTKKPFPKDTLLQGMAKSQKWAEMNRQITL